jgi:hypothetical protein
MSDKAVFYRDGRFAFAYVAPFVRAQADLRRNC